MSSPFNIFIKPLKINEVNRIMGLLTSLFKVFFQKNFIWLNLVTPTRSLVIHYTCPQKQCQISCFT